MSSQFRQSENALDGNVATDDATDSTSTSLVFDYTGAGGNAASLAATAVNLPGCAIIEDRAG